MNIGKALRQLLDSLPFNGQKLKLSGWFLLLSQLPLLFPGVDLMVILQAILANPTKSGIIAALVAALHKFLKTKYPSVE